jgi:uncharacterized protein YbjT (DUF2867 family)
MANYKSIVVLGGTGNQGGAVAKNLLENNFHVKVLTRKSDSPNAKKLKELHAEIISGDLDKPKTFSEMLKDAMGLFCVLTFDEGVEKEIERGVNLVNLAKANNVQHFLYSSIAGAAIESGVPLWESKRKIENYLKQTGIPYTIIRPNLLFETFLFPRIKNGILKGKLASPVNKDRVQQFIACQDIGKISVDIFSNPDKYLDKTITLGTEQFNLNQLAELFSKVLGRKIEYKKIPMFITRMVMGKDLYKMFKWVNHNNTIFLENIEQYRTDYPDYLKFEKWIEANFKNK